MVESIGFASYRQTTGQDAHSPFANPLFVDSLTLDLHLTDSSPAVNAGDAAFQPETGETDFDGDVRINGPRSDIGADEH
jgi:hypothetical protein